jgi:hypothetical protein
MKELYILIDLPIMGQLEETVLSNSMTNILGAYWEDYHDYLIREWDLIPF